MDSCVHMAIKPSMIFFVENLQTKAYTHQFEHQAIGLQGILRNTSSILDRHNITLHHFFFNEIYLICTNIVPPMNIFV